MSPEMESLTGSVRLPSIIAATLDASVSSSGNGGRPGRPGRLSTRPVVTAYTSRRSGSCGTGKKSSSALSMNAVPSAAIPPGAVSETP
jgi:hypothetical protein